jgi:DNA repair protein RAD5
MCRGVDVVLTTYGTLASEWSSFSSNRGTSHEGLYALHWTRVILDEAHTIKNKVHHTHTTKRLAVEANVGKT